MCQPKFIWFVETIIIPWELYEASQSLTAIRGFVADPGILSNNLYGLFLLNNLINSPDADQQFTRNLKKGD